MFQFTEDYKTRLKSELNRISGLINVIETRTMICQTEILSLSSVILVKSVVRMMFLRVCCILGSVAILSVQRALFQCARV